MTNKLFRAWKRKFPASNIMLTRKKLNWLVQNSKPSWHKIMPCRLRSLLRKSRKLSMLIAKKLLIWQSSWTIASTLSTNVHPRWRLRKPNCLNSRNKLLLLSRLCRIKRMLFKILVSNCSNSIIKLRTCKYKFNRN